MDGHSRRSSFIDTSLFPQPPSKKYQSETDIAVAIGNSGSGAHTPTQTQTFFRHLSTSSSELDSPTSQYSFHQSDHPFSSSVGHSNSSSDSRSRSTTGSSRSSVYSDNNDFDFDLSIKPSPLTISTNITPATESPIDPFFKSYTTTPKSPVLEELFRTQHLQSSDKPKARNSVDLFRLSLHASRPASPHPLHQNLSTSDFDLPKNSETAKGASDAVEVEQPHSSHHRQLYHHRLNSQSETPSQSPISIFLPLFSKRSSGGQKPKDSDSDSQKPKMPHVITQPPLSAANMLNRSNSASSESSFNNNRATMKAKPGKFGGFFGWGAANLPDEMSPTHEREISLAEQRMSKVPSSIDVSLANSQPSHAKRTDSGISLPPRTPMTVEETLEEELRAISSDLASSIRREMDLEDLVESLQSQAELQGRPSPAGRRTSDYFSDAGTGSSSYDLELPSKDQMDFDRVVRKSEQTQAQIRLEMMQKIQDERQRRKGVELQVRELEQQVSRVDMGSMMGSDSGRVRELEVALDDARRKLSEERNLKANFEDLVTAIKEELQGYRNERDNLRDEVVPQLRARVEGLEAELAESQKSPYEQTKLQQEIDALRAKNASLMETHRQIVEMRSQGEQMLQAQPAVSPVATPVSATFKDKDSLLERMKEVEAQRDALQQGLKTLRMRSEFDNKKSTERIKTLEFERDRALRPTYRKMRKDKENASFRTQLERLRYRAEDAIESKYMCERNFSSLQLDLDRSIQELDDLKSLLREEEALARELSDLQEEYKQFFADSRGDAEIDQLADDLRSRAVANSMLRKRFIDAIEKGEQDRLMAKSKINTLCEMLKTLEEKIADAQQDLEEAAQEREQERKDMRETNPNYLRRIDENTTSSFQSKGNPLSDREPQIATNGGTSGKTKDSRVYVLQHRIDQLEKAVSNSDTEMSDVEARLNVTFLEASELRLEREQSSQYMITMRGRLSSL